MHDAHLLDRAFFQRSLRDLVRRDGGSHELRRFYERNRTLIWTTEERAYVDRISCVGGWWKLWYSIEQEMRAYRQERADPDRLTINANSIAGRAARALMVPMRLLYRHEQEMTPNWSRNRDD